MEEMICAMEGKLNRCRAAVDALVRALDGFDEVQQDLDVLAAYYGSDTWFRHLAADEQGVLPPSLRGGVLSEDALFDLLTDADALRRRIGSSETEEKT